MCHIAPWPSPHRWCTSSILSTDLQIPLQLQSNDAAHGFPAWPFHSQSAHSKKVTIFRFIAFFYVCYVQWTWIDFLSLPMGVPQQRLLSSICSTSRPMNQDPKETSSFAYLWRSCLKNTLSNCVNQPLERGEDNCKEYELRELTGLLRYKLLNLWRWHRFVQSHVWSICFLLHQTSNIPAHGIWLLCNTISAKMLKICLKS